LAGTQGLVDEIEKLKALNHKLRFSVYIPRKEDKIDNALSEFINKVRPEQDPMNIMFLRESEGVYQYGSKRVYIKVGKERQVLVRVGGGFMNIEDFIN